MTTTAPDLQKLRELDDGTRLAWMAYNERLRDLDGEEYERAESDSWTELQTRAPQSRAPARLADAELSPPSTASAPHEVDTDRCYVLPSG